MRRQGERPELIRWRLCGTSKTWSFVPQDENAPRPRTLLVVSELTLSLMLLIGAGLLIRSFVRLQSVPPGVVAEGVVSALPLTGEVGWGGISVEGYTPPPGQELQVDIRVAGTDYFRTMEIPLRKGRFFTEDDNADKPQAVIIDEKFAQRFWPDSDPIGKHLWFDPKKLMTIVGVVGVVKQYGLEADGKVATYFLP